MAWKFWEKSKKRSVLILAAEYCKPLDDFDLKNTALYIQKCLAKEGINETTGDIQSFLSCPQKKKKPAGARDGAKSTTSNINESSDCNSTNKNPLQSTTLNLNTINSKGEENQQKCDATIKEEIPAGKSGIDNKIKKSVNQNGVGKVPDRNNKNNSTESDSGTSKTDTGTTNIEGNETSTTNEFLMPKMNSSKICRQSTKSLKLKQSHDPQPGMKRRRPGTPDMACSQGARDGAKSTTSNINESSDCNSTNKNPLQSTTLNLNTINSKGEENQQKCDATIKEEIPAGKSGIDNKIKKSINQNDVGKVPDRNNKNNSTESDSGTSKTDTGTTNIEGNETSTTNEFLMPKMNSSKICRQSTKSLKLKQSHDPQPGMKRRRPGTPDMACSQDRRNVAEFMSSYIENESNSNHTRTNSLKSPTPELNTNNVDGEVTQNECNKTIKENITDEKSDKGSNITVPKRPNNSEKIHSIGNVLDKNIINNISGFEVIDFPKIETGHPAHIEDNETGTNNDIPKTDSTKICRQGNKSLKLKKSDDAQPAAKRRRSGALDVACSEGTENLTDTVSASVKEILIGSDIRIETKGVMNTKCDESIQIKKEISDKLNEIRIDKTSKNKKKSENRVITAKVSDKNKRPSRSASNAKTFTVISDDIIIENLNLQSGMNESLKTNSSKILVHVDVHLPLENTGTNIATTTCCGNSDDDINPRKLAKVDNESAPVKPMDTEVSKNHTYFDAQSPKQTRAATKSPTLISVKETAINTTTNSENETNGKVEDTVYSKIQSQCDVQKPLLTRATRKSSTLTNANVSCTSGTKTNVTYEKETSNEQRDTVSSKNNPHSEVQKPLLTRGGRKSSTLTSENKSATSGSEANETFENETNNGHKDTVSSKIPKIQPQCDVKKPLLTRAAKRSSTLTSKNVSGTSGTKTNETFEKETNNEHKDTVPSKIQLQCDGQKPLLTRSSRRSSTLSSENLSATSGTKTNETFENEKSNEYKDAVSSKNNPHSEAQKPLQTRAARKNSIQPRDVTSVKIIGDSAQAESSLQATALSVPKTVELSIKQEPGTKAKLKKEPGTIRKAYCRARKKKYQQKKRLEAKLRQLMESPIQDRFQPGERQLQNHFAQRPFCQPFPGQYPPLRPRHPKIIFSQLPLFRPVFPQRPAYVQCNSSSPSSPFWQSSYTSPLQNPNLIYVKPLRRFVNTKAEESPDICTRQEEEPQGNVKEETRESKEIPATQDDSSKIETDYYASEKVEEANLEAQSIEPLHLPFKKIKLTTPQSPPLCSFEDVKSILASATSSYTTAQPDPSSHIPAVEDLSSYTQDQPDLSSNVPSVQDISSDQHVEPDSPRNDPAGQEASATSSYTTAQPDPSSNIPAVEDLSSYVKDQPDLSSNLPSVQDISSDQHVEPDSPRNDPAVQEGVTGPAKPEPANTFHSPGSRWFIDPSVPLSPSMVYPDTPRSTKQTPESSQGGNESEINEALLTKITGQVYEVVSEQISKRVEKKLKRCQALQRKELKQMEQRICRLIRKTCKPGAKK